MTLIKGFEKAFANKSNPGKLEEELFKPLISKRLYDHALQEYSEFALLNTFRPSNITRNAYLIHYMAYTENEKLPQMAADEIDFYMNNASLRSTITLLKHGPEYLEIDEPISDDLIAASIASKAINNNSDNMKYIGLIGSNAINIAHHGNLLLNDNSHFKKSTTTPETKALHLAQTLHAMREMIVHVGKEIGQSQAYSEKSGLAMQKIKEMIENIVPTPGNSELETLVHERYQTMDDLFEGAAVNTNNIITPLHP